MTVRAALGVAMGCMHMSLDDFQTLRPAEFIAAADAWQSSQDADVRRSWEIARTVAAILLQPHARRRLTVRSVLQLPWDAPVATRSSQHAPALTREAHRQRQERQLREQQRRRFEEVCGRLEERQQAVPSSTASVASSVS